MTKNKFVLGKREIGKSDNKMQRLTDTQSPNYNIIPSTTRELQAKNSSSSTTNGIVIQVPLRTPYKSTEDGEIMFNKGHQKSSGTRRTKVVDRQFKNLH